MDKESVFDKGATQSGSTTKTHWTIMLYIVADDVLTNFAVESLKQLTESFNTRSGATGNASVVVAAQFALPLNAAQPVSAEPEASDDLSKRRYIFKKGNGGNLNANLVRPLSTTTDGSGKASVSDKSKSSDKVNLSEEEALKDFLQWVDSHDELKAERYALILWGHGPELLFQPTPPNPTGEGNSLYLTPMQLRGALTYWKDIHEGRSLEIVGFDACFMSMLEMACELKGLAKYMVASQDEVPDASFPYDNLVKLFRQDANMPLDLLLEGGLKAYVSAYQDCICNINTGMRPVTLSVLDLEKGDKLKKAVGSLACALLKAKDEAGLADLLIGARSLSLDYAGGLYVDLNDFCTRLSGQLPNAGEKWEKIQLACREVLTALTKGKPNLILDNSDQKNGGGISIYLPYLTNPQYAEVSKPLVKGGTGTRGGKGFSDMLNGAATEYVMCARRNLILDTENYYANLLLSKTHWYDFIAEQWTRALIKNAPADLDYHYSVQQSWINVSRTPIDTAKLC
jgi:hypothetical protein